MQEFKAGLVLAVVVSVLLVMAYAQTLGPSPYEYHVSHVYEDGCMDVQDGQTGDIVFMCEADFK